MLKQKALRKMLITSITVVILLMIYLMPTNSKTSTNILDVDKKIEYTMKNIEGKDYLQYEWIEINKIDEYPLLPRAVKEVLKENKFPIHKINNDLK